MSSHPSRNCWIAGEKKYVKEEGGVIPQAFGPVAVIRGSPKAASIYIRSRPQARKHTRTCIIKNEKGRKP